MATTKILKNRRGLSATWLYALRKACRANSHSAATRPFFNIFVMLLLFGTPLFAQTVTVPHLINFQSVVNGTGGVPLVDGIHSVRFRLLNAVQESLYEETQSVESIAGVVSAMIGSAVEIPFAVLAPGQARFLGVTAEGAGPETVMEIVSSPYALYAEQALQVAPKSVGTESIVPKSITADLLADDVLQNLLPANLVQQSQLDVLKGDYRSAFGAGKIGVDTTFVYSKGPTVQNVLKDFDTAIYQRQMNLEKQSSDLTSRINTSTKALQDKDDSLQRQTDTINATIGQLKDADAWFRTQIDTKLATAGGTMSGILNMGRNRVENVGIPVNSGDVATKAYVDGVVSASEAPPPGGFPPAVSASGIVRANGDLSTGSCSSPSISGYKINGISRTGDVGDRQLNYVYHITFSQTIEPPYIVIGNAILAPAWPLQEPDTSFVLHNKNLTNSGFDAQVVNGADGGGKAECYTDFNFVVYK
ncbi:MAG: hypothetical protein HY877_03755 [Deltaproteobacteria bacterium]|nr:hypothetical protein [Deltaproteobacteria bacterium]